MSPTVHGETAEAVWHQRPDPGVVVRVARTAAGWSQAELGRRCGYSASQVSRWETGRLPLRDTTLLRTLAKILTLHPTVFGLTEGDTTERPSPSLTGPSHRVGRVTTPATEEDPVRRRTFLQLTGLTGPARHRALIANIVSHRVSVAYLLGDAGTALAHARAFPLAAIPTTERRARLLVDTALAYAQWDKPARAYTTLLRAERTAPGEVHTRNAARQLVTDLMASPKQAAMPGLPALARRVHALT